jgi:hypothetical protein
MYVKLQYAPTITVAPCSNLGLHKQQTMHPGGIYSQNG